MGSRDIVEDGPTVGELRRIAAFVRRGHTEHCGARIVWGDGSCECGKRRKRGDRFEPPLRLPFKDPLVLAIAEDIRASEGNADGLYKTETRRLSAPRAKAGDVMLVCEALALAEDLRSSKPKINYRADDQPLLDWKDAGEWMEWRWKVSTLAAMYCPTWAVRHHRRLLEVRREPLSAITDEGARAEGIARLGWEPTREGFLAGFRAFRGLAGDADPEVTVYRWQAGEVPNAD